MTESRNQDAFLDREHGPVIGQGSTLQAAGEPLTVGERRIVKRTQPMVAARPPGQPPARASLSDWRPLRIIVLVVAALLLAAFMNADHLVDRAEKKPFGESRDFWLGVWEPVQSVSDALYLNRPRQWMDKAVDREIDDGASDPFVQNPEPSTTPPAGAPTTPSATVTATGTPSSTPPATGSASATPSPSATPSASPTAATPGSSPLGVRIPTKDAPMKMFIGGDSMAVAFGESLARMASATGVITPDLAAHASSGLSRPDFYDWPTRLLDVATNEKPDVMVIIFGANDSQGVKNPDGDIFQPLSDGWRAEYRRRVSATMDLVTAPGRLVVWMGQPAMEDADFSAKMADINAIYRDEAAKRPGMLFFDAWPLFVDASGNYSGFLPGDDGTELDMRASDGIHLSRNGADRLAKAVLEAIRAQVPYQ